MHDRIGGFVASVLEILILVVPGHPAECKVVGHLCREVCPELGPAIVLMFDAAFGGDMGCEDIELRPIISETDAGFHKWRLEVSESGFEIIAVRPGGCAVDVQRQRPKRDGRQTRYKILDRYAVSQARQRGVYFWRAGIEIYLGGIAQHRLEGRCDVNGLLIALLLRSCVAGDRQAGGNGDANGYRLEDDCHFIRMLADCGSHFRLCVRVTCRTACCFSFLLP